MNNHKSWIYLDHAAATPLADGVRAAMEPFWAEQFYNPSATYGPAVAVARQLQAARARVAYWLGARPSEIIFTAGGTEANNLAIDGLMVGQSEANIVVGAIEHESVLAPAGRYQRRLAPFDGHGIVSLDGLRRLIDDNTRLVSIMYANNEIGSVQPVKAIGELIATVRADRRRRGVEQPIYLHSDACQAPAYLDLHVARLGVDLMTINGGKMYGPKQSGALYVKAGVDLQPLLLGGGQERGLRSGTENVAACIGLAAALDLVQAERRVVVRRLQGLQRLFIDEVARMLPVAVVNGSRKQRLPNNVHLTLPGYDNERLLYQLEAHSVLAAAGSACSAANDEPSHVLRAIGLSDDDARASLRFTMGRATTDDQVRQAAAALAACVGNR